MATCTAPDIEFSLEELNIIGPREKKWSEADLLKEIRRYLWRYGSVTDRETDPIELLRQAFVALETQEQRFEDENATDSTMIEELQKRIKQLESENTALKASASTMPAWWQG